MHPYKMVERALTRMHGDTGAAAMRINAKVKHFIRLGFTPESPGKGQRISYTFENAAKWAYGLQILEHGIDPTAMLRVVQQTWESVWRAMEKGNHGQNELMVATPNAISHPDGWHAFAFGIRQSQQYQPDWSEIDRTMVINVSRVSRRLRTALEEAEAGMLRDLSDEIKSIRAGEANLAHIAAALQNATPGAELHIGGINGGALVQERGPDGELRDVLPAPRKPRRATKPIDSA